LGELLKQEEAARRVFKTTIEYQRTLLLNANELAAWDPLAIGRQQTPAGQSNVVI
jgi:hypothetical protein